MRKSNLKLLALGLFILLAQNSLSAKYQAGDGSVATDGSVAVGLDNKAGNLEEIFEDYYAAAFGLGNIASGHGSSAFGQFNEAGEAKSSAFGRSNTASGEESSAVGYK